MEMEKKNIAIYVLAIALIASGVGNIIFVAYGEDIWGGGTEGGVLRVAQVGNIDTIDPVDSWDAPSNDLMNQVTEPLFWVDITSQSSPTDPLQLVPCLAQGYSYNNDGTELTINLRRKIYFHDGELMDAEAVKYSLERLMYWTNSSGDLPSDEVKGFPWSLYYFADGTTPIMKSVEATGEYQVKITLSSAYGPFVPLLSYTASNIVSPNTPKTKLLSYTLNETLVGTGPFVYDHYTTDVEYVLTKNDNWWGGQLENGQKIGGPYFDKVICVIYSDATTASNAMLGNEVDYGGVIASLLPTAKADPDIKVTEWGTGMCYFYWGINCKMFSQPLRLAIAHSLNYTYVLEEIRRGLAVKANTCIPTALPGGVEDLDTPQYDVAAARAKMNEIYGTDLKVDVDSAWTTRAENNPFETIKLFRHLGSHFNELLNTMVEDNLKSIGIATTEEIGDWSTFLTYSGPDNRDNLELWYIGWCPDYLDPFNMLNPLFNPTSDSASHQGWEDAELGEDYQDNVAAWLAEAEVETNENNRIQLYRNIQEYLFDGEDAFLAHIPMFYSKLNYVHYDYLENVAYNSMQSWYWAATYFG